VSGNVSLYNESKATGGGSAILPTPAIGGVGVLEDVSKMATIAFKKEGSAIVLLSDGTCSDKFTPGHLGQSLWLREIAGREGGKAPEVDLKHERLVGKFVRKIVDNGNALAVHDVSDGGWLVAISEMALAGGIGAKILPDWLLAGPDWPFGEHQGRYIVETQDYFKLLDAANAAGVGADCLGTVTGSALVDDYADGRTVALNVSLTDLRAAHESFFKNWMEG
jgi:phosphoribosylformylglycinamidine synthase subunit PurL